MNLLKIPYGISNYRMIREEGYVYVDKTRFIRVLEDFPEPYVFFLRPRRFGKSLFVSMLGSYYDINGEEKFDLYFSGSDIGRSPTSNKNRYYVLNFDFSGIITDSDETIKRSFSKKTCDSLNDFIRTYCPHLPLFEVDDAPTLLSHFFSMIPHEIDGPVYVMIDEYDHFANELLSFDPVLFQDIVSHNGFVRKWYEVLKEATKRSVRRVFATGVSPVTLDSLTSGFNIGKNLTRSPKLNEMMGFTEDEVLSLIQSTLPPDNISPDMLQTLRGYYNGYLFSEKASDRIFNSDMILYYLSSIVERGEPPELLLDVNIASDYGKLGRLTRLKAPESNIRVIRDIISGDEVSARLTPQFSMEKAFSRDDFISLLFYLGLITIKNAIPGEVTLTIPNYVIRGLYYDFFIQVIAEEGSGVIEHERIREAVRELGFEGRCTMLVQLIEELLHGFSNRDFIGFDERYIKIALLTFAHMSNLFLVRSEYEVANGYVDVALLHREPWHPRYYALFELKYLKLRDYSEERADQLVREGKDQLIRYGASPEFAGIENLKRWVLVFAGDRCVRVNEV